MQCYSSPGQTGARGCITMKGKPGNFTDTIYKKLQNRPEFSEQAAMRQALNQGF
jgi:hypothetical protein